MGLVSLLIWIPLTHLIGGMDKGSFATFFFLWSVFLVALLIAREKEKQKIKLYTECSCFSN